MGPMAYRQNQTTTFLNYVTQALGVQSLYLAPLVAQVSKVSPAQTPLENSKIEFFFDQTEVFHFKNLNAKNNQVKFLVLHLKKQQSVFANETRELFSKMVLSLKRPPQQLLVLEVIGAANSAQVMSYLNSELTSPMKVLIFSEGESHSESLIRGLHTFYVTHSPYDFIKSGDLKKVAWAVMQKFIS
jgi:hypothetical protein